jgi:ABC-type multidrug transport system fused ATPase/permease subunit
VCRGQLLTAIQDQHQRVVNLVGIVSTGVAWGGSPIRWEFQPTYRKNRREDNLLTFNPDWPDRALRAPELAPLFVGGADAGLGERADSFHSAPGGPSSWTVWLAGNSTTTALLGQLGWLVLAGVLIYFLRVAWRLQLFAASYRLGRSCAHAFMRACACKGRTFFHQRGTGDLMALATNDIDAVEMASGEAMLAGFDGTLTLVSWWWP